jgi:hypothetical protein
MVFHREGARFPMKRRAFVTFVAFFVAFVAGGALESAPPVTAQFEFPFVAGGKEMPAGTYTIEVPVGGPVMLRGAAGSSGLMAIITTLGRHDKDHGSEFVFDKIDGTYMLSEIWPADEDGLLVLVTAKPHSHAVVGGSNPRK